VKIGLIVFSQTGNTRGVSNKIAGKLSSAGHDVKIEEISIEGKTPAQPGQFKLINVPDINNYEAVIFGAPVQAFSLNPVMKEYLEQVESLANKNVACFVTKQIPLLWFGGTGSIATMRNICKEKGANILGTEIVVWAEAKRNRSIENCINNISQLFKQ